MSRGKDRVEALLALVQRDDADEIERAKAAALLGRLGTLARPAVKVLVRGAVHEAQGSAFRTAAGLALVRLARVLPEVPEALKLERTTESYPLSARAAHLLEWAEAQRK